jgi:integrase
MTTLTNTALDAMTKGQKLNDDRVPGLYAVRNRDAVSFMLYYRTKLGVQRCPKIGTYGILTIAKVRDLARDMLAEVQSGRDPGAERNASRGEPNMDDLWKRCEAEVYNKDKTWDRQAKGLYLNHCSPVIGRERVKAIDFEHIERVKAKGIKTPITANRAIAVLQKMLKRAELWRYRPVGTNPTKLVERYPARKRRRHATLEELGRIIPILERHALLASSSIVSGNNRATIADVARLAGVAQSTVSRVLKGLQTHKRTHSRVMAAVKELGYEPGVGQFDPGYVASGIAFLYILFYSGARPSEIERSTPDMVERREHNGVTTNRIFIANGKTGRREIFLPPQAVNILAQLPKDRKTLTGAKRLPRDLWEKIREEAGCPDLWARDFRRTFATAAKNDGMAIAEISGMLGHKSIQTTMTYLDMIAEPVAASAAVTRTANALDRMVEAARKTPKIDPLA